MTCTYKFEAELVKSVLCKT